MIIFRYLFRELITMTMAVCAVLLMVIMSGRFVKYLAQAVAGNLDSEILFALIGYRIPSFIELILPLAFFLAILLTFGRFYVESEMTVLTACGVSTKRLVSYVLMTGTLVAATVFWLSLYVSPAGVAKVDALLNAQKKRSELEGMSARRFYRLREQRGVTYVEQIKGDILNNVFLAEGRPDGRENESPVLILAERGRSLRDEAHDSNLLLLENGYRIQGNPGRADFQITRFDEYGQRLKKPINAEMEIRGESIPTEELIGSTDIADIAVLQWRLSVSILVLVVTLIAVPLSKTNPRQGRFLKMLPAVILYIFYLVALSTVRGKMEEGELSAMPGLWWVHLVFLGLAAVLLGWENLQRGMRRHRSRGTV